MNHFRCPKCEFESHNPNDLEQMYCSRCKQFVEDMRDEEVHEFDHLDCLSARTLPLTYRDCFSLAALTLMESPDNEEARLVHAWVKHHKGHYIEHAWCEFPAIAHGVDDDGTESEFPVTVVIDYSQIHEPSRIRPRDEIYEAMQPTGIVRYTREEMIAMAIKYGNDGPWPEGEKQ